MCTEVVCEVNKTHKTSWISVFMHWMTYKCVKYIILWANVINSIVYRTKYNLIMLEEHKSFTDNRLLFNIVHEYRFLLMN